MLNSRPVAGRGEAVQNHALARTPARGLLKNHGVRQENALYIGALAGNAQGKTTLLQTPFRPSTVGKGIITGKAHAMTSKPLGDKTPFPNRQLPAQTPVPQILKPSKLGIANEMYAKTPGALLLPSARRKSLRLPRSASKKFKTPAQQGRHWDVSDGEVDPDVSVGSAEQAEEEWEDYDEIEYMPPKVLEQPYEPPFDMPDYQQAGKTLFNIAHSYLRDDTQDLFYAADIEVEIEINQLLKDSGGFEISSLPLPELADDNFLSSFDEIVDDLEDLSYATRPKEQPIQRPTTKVSTSSDAPAPSRPMTRAAARRQAPIAVESRAPTPTTRITRSSSRLARGGSSLARTPSSDASSGSRPVSRPTSRQQSTAGMRVSSRASARGGSQRNAPEENIIIFSVEPAEDNFEFAL